MTGWSRATQLGPWAHFCFWGIVPLCLSQLVFAVLFSLLGRLFQVANKDDHQQLRLIVYPAKKEQLRSQSCHQCLRVSLIGLIGSWAPKYIALGWIPWLPRSASHASPCRPGLRSTPPIPHGPRVWNQNQKEGSTDDILSPVVGHVPQDILILCAVREENENRTKNNLRIIIS